MNKMLKYVKAILVIICLLLIAIISVACVSTKPNDDNNKPTVSVIEQLESSNINIFVNKINSAEFTIPVVVDVNLSMFNTGTASTNENLFVNNITGEYIEDLSIVGIQRDCFGRSGNYTNNKYVCTFEFSVSANDNWNSNGLIRKISHISFRIFDKTINVPVNVSIYEKVEDVKFINECEILNNIKYSTLVNKQIPQMEYRLALNWDITGWGASDWDDDKYAAIVGFRFANSAFKLDSFNIIIDNEEGYAVPERNVSLDLNNVNYDLTSRQCYWSGNFVSFTVSSTNEAEQCVSDSLIMQYTLNGGNEVYEVNLATIQMYDYDSLLDRMA